MTLSPMLPFSNVLDNFCSAIFFDVQTLRCEGIVGSGNAIPTPPSSSQPLTLLYLGAFYVPYRAASCHNPLYGVYAQHVVLSIRTDCVVFHKNADQYDWDCASS